MTSPPLTAAELARFLRTTKQMSQHHLDQAAFYLDSLDAMEKALEETTELLDKYFDLSGTYQTKRGYAIEEVEMLKRAQAALSSLSALKGKTE